MSECNITTRPLLPVFAAVSNKSLIQTLFCLIVFHELGPIHTKGILLLLVSVYKNPCPHANIGLLFSKKTKKNRI